MGVGGSCLKNGGKSKNYQFSDVILNGESLREGKSPAKNVTSSYQKPPFSITSSDQSGNHQNQNQPRFKLYDRFDGVSPSGAVIARGFQLPLYERSPYRVKRTFSGSSGSPSAGRSPVSPVTPLTDRDVSSFFTDSLLELPDIYYEYSRYSRPLSCHL